MSSNAPKSQTDAEQLDLAVRAAWLSFIGGYTQGDVAKRLGISPVKAHRLIQFAQQHGMVKVFVEGAPARCVALEERIIKAFNLSSCLVTPSDATANQDDAMSFNEVGAGAARFFYNLLQKLPPKSSIGVGKGRSLSALAERLPRVNREDLVLASVSGSLTRKFSTNKLDVIQQLVERTGGEGYFMPVPYLAKDEAEHRVLMQQASVQFSLNLARNANVYVIGLGALQTNHYLHSVGLVSDQDLEQLREAGAVCDLIGSFYDIQGKLVDHPLNNQGLGIKAQEMVGKQVVAVAGGLGKELAVLGGLRAGLISDLVVGESTAEKIVLMLEASPNGNTNGR